MKGLFQFLAGEGVSFVAAEDEDLAVNHYFAIFNNVIILILNTRCFIRCFKCSFIGINQFVFFILSFHLEEILGVGIQTGNGISEAFVL